MIRRAALCREQCPKVLGSNTGQQRIRISVFGFLSDFGLRLSDFAKPSLALGAACLRWR
jgi:hypothetical protein